MEGLLESEWYVLPLVLVAGVLGFMILLSALQKWARKRSRTTFVVFLTVKFIVLAVIAYFAGSIWYVKLGDVNGFFDSAGWYGLAAVGSFLFLVAMVGFDLAISIIMICFGIFIICSIVYIVYMVWTAWHEEGPVVAIIQGIVAISILGIIISFFGGMFGPRKAPDKKSDPEPSRGPIGGTYTTEIMLIGDDPIKRRAARKIRDTFF